MRMLMLSFVLAFIVPSAAISEASGSDQSIAPNKFRKEQRVYVVGVEAASRDLSGTRANLALERLAKDQFKKAGAFRVVNTLRDSDFVFFVMVDSASRNIEEVALAVSPVDYERLGGNLDALRNAALWQGENHFKAGRAVASLGWSEVFHSQNVVAGLVKQFHKEAIGH